MEKQMQLFNFENQQVRTLIINEEPYFVGKDIAIILGYKKPENAIANHVEDEDKTTTLIQGTGSNYKSKTVIVNESGMYSLILSSKLPNAKRFKHWVTSKVLPAIRKTGSYQLPQTPEELLSLTVQATNHLTKRMNTVEEDIDFLMNKSEVDEK